MELRSLIMNWLATLNASEQTRIINEITTRLADYLNSDYQDFEISRVAKINLTDLKFQNSLEIEGIIPDSSFIDYRNSNLKIITISANGIFNKINWLVTGQTVAINDPNNSPVVNRAYIINSNLQKSFPKKLTLITVFVHCVLPMTLRMLPLVLMTKFI